MDEELEEAQSLTKEDLLAMLQKTCDPTKESRLSPVPHNYKVVDTEYGSLGDGGSYDVLVCEDCGRRAYSMLPD